MNLHAHECFFLSTQVESTHHFTNQTLEKKVHE